MERRYLTSINLRILLLLFSLGFTVWGAGVIAQTSRADERLDRQLEQMERQQQGMRVTAEREWGVIKADIKVLQEQTNGVKGEINAIKNLGIGIISAMALLIVQSLWGLITNKVKSRDHA